MAPRSRGGRTQDLPERPTSPCRPWASGSCLPHSPSPDCGTRDIIRGGSASVPDTKQALSQAPKAWPALPVLSLTARMPGALAHACTHTSSCHSAGGSGGGGARLPAGLEGPGGWSRGRAPPLLGLQGPRQRDAHGAADPLQQRREQLGVQPEHRGPGRRHAHHLVQRACGLGTGAASGSALPRGLAAVKAGPCTPKPAHPRPTLACVESSGPGRAAA